MSQIWQTLLQVHVHAQSICFHKTIYSLIDVNELDDNVSSMTKFDLNNHNIFWKWNAIITVNEPDNNASLITKFDLKIITFSKSEIAVMNIIFNDILL